MRGQSLIHRFALSLLLALGTPLGILGICGSVTIAAVTCGGCASLDTSIETSAIAPTLERVLDRAEAYTLTDEEPEDPQALSLLGSIAGLRALLQLDRIPPGRLEAAGLVSVCEYHDRKIRSDVRLSDLEIAVYLGDTAALIHVASAASDPM